jgi:hypothetical protein
LSAVGANTPTGSRAPEHPDWRTERGANTPAKDSP